MWPFCVVVINELRNSHSSGPGAGFPELHNSGIGSSGKRDNWLKNFEISSFFTFAGAKSCFLLVDEKPSRKYILYIG